MRGVTLQSGVLYIPDGQLVAPTVSVLTDSIFGGGGTIVGDVNSTGGTISPGYIPLGTAAVNLSPDLTLGAHYDSILAANQFSQSGSLELKLKF